MVSIRYPLGWLVCEINVDIDIVLTKRQRKIWGCLLQGLSLCLFVAYWNISGSSAIPQVIICQPFTIETQVCHHDSVNFVFCIVFNFCLSVNTPFSFVMCYWDACQVCQARVTILNDYVLYNIETWQSSYQCKSFVDLNRRNSPYYGTAQHKYSDDSAMG
jgi:hypothetical protein